VKRKLLDVVLGSVLAKLKGEQNMKKMSVVCMMIVCSVVSGFASPRITQLGVYLSYPEQKAERLREDLKDVTKLKECMVNLVGAYSPREDSPERIEEFKRRFGVSDKAMETALMDIVSKAGVKNRWEKRQVSSAVPLDFAADWQVTWGLVWLSFCAETDGKTFLMDIAMDGTKADEFRIRSALSYMSRADVQEARKAIVRFLSDEMGTVAKHYAYDNLYHDAIRIYDKAKDDAQTREAIITVMSAALAKETNKGYFLQADKLLAERSTEYAESPQRKAALERMNKPPEKETP